MENQRDSKYAACGTIIIQGGHSLVAGEPKCHSRISTNRPKIKILKQISLPVAPESIRIFYFFN